MKQIDPGLQFFGDAVEARMRLDDLTLFLDEVDTFLSTAAESLNGVTTREDESLFYQFAEPLPEILFSSFVISVVSFVERQAQGYARVLHLAANTPITMSDLSGAWYERFRKFAERLAKLDLGLSNADWSNLKCMVEVRNCLAHSGGDLSNFQRRSIVEQFLSRHRLDVPVDDYIQANRSLAEMCLQICRAFIDAIYRAAIERYPSKA